LGKIASCRKIWHNTIHVSQEQPKVRKILFGDVYPHLYGEIADKIK
jgi:hypothetical protein